MPRLRILVARHSAFYGPLLVTLAAGFLKAEGLEADYRTAAPGETVFDALRTGAADIAQSAVSQSWPRLEGGGTLDHAHFAAINVRDGFFLVGRRPEPSFAWRRLEGRAIVADHGNQPLAMLRFGLHRQGVALERVRLIDAGGPETMIQRFRDGDGDYVHLQGPAAHRVAIDGGAIIARIGDAVGPVAFSSLVARRDFLATDAARAFLRAYRRGRALANEAPPGQLAEIEAPLFPDTPPAALVAAIADYQHLGCWTGDVAIQRADYARALDVFAFAGAIGRRHPFDRVVVPPPDEPGR